jgi:hypothetical protein
MDGYDLDNTICRFTENWTDKVMFKMPPFVSNKWAKFRKSKAKVIFRPLKDDFHIITARPEVDRKWTEAWLDENGIYPIELIMAHKLLSLEEVIDFKARVIIWKRIDRYFEDNVKIVEGLRKKGIRVVQV